MFRPKLFRALVAIACTSFFALAVARFACHERRRSGSVQELAWASNDTLARFGEPASMPDSPIAWAAGHADAVPVAGDVSAPDASNGAGSLDARMGIQAAHSICSEVEVVYVDVDARGVARSAWLATGGGLPQKVALGEKYGAATLVSASAADARHAPSVVLEGAGARCSTGKPRDPSAPRPDRVAVSSADDPSDRGAPPSNLVKGLEAIRRLTRLRETPDGGVDRP